jgi:O-antigen/teichoic acid export membrane protein
MKVLIPLASELHAENDYVRLRSLYLAGIRLTLASILPKGFTLVISARAILPMWVCAIGYWSIGAHQTEQ